MENRLAVAAILRDFDTAMMVTHAQSGPLDVRPMHVAAMEIAEGGPLWFVTSVESHAAMELAGDGRTLLVFQDRTSGYVAIWGAARIVDDRARLQRLWTPPLLAWFPDGPSDEDLRLLEFTPHSAEVWQHGATANARYVLEDAGQHARTRT
jgi:general stress protein 26